MAGRGGEARGGNRSYLRQIRYRSASVVARRRSEGPVCFAATSVCTHSTDPRNPKSPKS